MQLIIHIPLKAQIINGGFSLAVAPSGKSWSKSQLGDYADRKGVYVHHANGQILYIGRTTSSGDYATFGERLRREFQEKASSNSDLYKLLLAQTQPIRAYLLDLEDIEAMVDAGPLRLSGVRKALIMEQVLIGLFDPIGKVGS